MPRIITFIGAGSFGFTRGLVKDILTFPKLADAEIRLMDIDPERLDFIYRAVTKIKKKGHYPCKIKKYSNRRSALKDADGVVCTILQGGVDIFKSDIEIPMKYGVNTNIGDTRGPSGIFRALRTIPVMLDICKDISEVCPKAIFLNYTNPMAMLCNAMQKAYPQLTISGLCHSVQGTIGMLAGWIGAPMEEVTYTCAGVNHQAHYIEFKWKGEDAYPLLREAVKKPEIYRQELVRNEMFLNLDYYVTESSGDNSEYVAWFRKREDLLKKYCSNHEGANWNPGEYHYIVDEYQKVADTWKDNIKRDLEADIDLRRGHEYAAYIFNACFGDNTLFDFNGNVPNHGSIENMPYDCCVEVPVVASKYGLRTCHVGKLPDQLALLNNITARCEELAVTGALEGDKRKVFHAVLFDPLTSAVLSMEETQKMVDEMFEANKDYLGYFKD